MAVQAQTRWQRAQVVEVSDVADGIRRIVLAPEQPEHAAPGTHIDVQIGDDARRVRSYSVVRSEDGGRRLTLSVRLSPTSSGGSAAMHRLRVGDDLGVTGPLQNFPLAVGATRYVLVAGGIGVTALVAMASALRRRGADYQLVLVGRSRAAMAYLDDLVAEHGDRVRVHVDDEGTSLAVEDLVAGIARTPAAAGTELYMCGPIGLMNAISRRWAEHDLPTTNLRFETFGSGGQHQAEEFLVRLPDLDREIVVAPDTSILDALEAAGVDTLSDCRKGECGLCLAKVVDSTGTIDHRDVFLSDSQKERSNRLCLCVSRAVASGSGSGDPAVLSLRLT
ncbi:vanillate O-demethylase ferredoxin subunit [Saccharopolyspora antimicrobica]|uniref:Vanillate O-demethylase ferredoxin subunit n=1 Tax=Saccharopolyspora antimicrobica TaxID=455193 RepID=A0A1I4W0T1_9PSEU|nr:PDR/VanB family oxidoreductase [Saccharopolyspora antimicrobica]RKT87124.1 vanillate demethylase subunit B [Saccharopolyspora antimicrobica]SFN07101.1 vanillate O-demethylase ferredoxin subunit [Saccharopolyspora antimicrobica]